MTPAAYRRDVWIIAAVLIAVLCVVFAPFLFGNSSLLNSAKEAPSLYAEGATADQNMLASRVLDAGAPAWLADPWFQVTHRLLFDEHAPFWNPDDGYGKPYAAGLEPQPFYPLTDLLALAPGPRTYAFYVVARFLIAGFFAALFVRLFTDDPWGPIAGGIATMLCGYYLMYYGMPHLSVDVGFPMLLWATELAVRRASAARIATLGIAAAVMYVGGGAESALLAVSAAGIYALVRFFTTPGRLPGKVGSVAAGNLLGAALGAAVLVPFAEYTQHSFTSHAPNSFRGLVYDTPWQLGLFNEFFPHAMGAPFSFILTNGIGWSHTRGFVGCAAFTLAVVALLTAFRRRDARLPVIAVLASIAAYAIFKRFGDPVVNWTGALPGFRQIDFTKYLGFVLGDTIGILAGFGVAYVREGRAGWRIAITAFACTLAIITPLFLAVHAAAPEGDLGLIFTKAVILGLAMLFACLAAAIAATRLPERFRIGAVAVLALLLVMEPLLGFVRNTTWRAPSIADNPFAGAPYLTYLQRHTAAEHERVFAVRGMLFPVWASAFGLADPRSLGGLLLTNYLPFVNAFLRPDPAPTFDDLADRFTGTQAFDTSTALFHRWLSLSSVGYYVEPQPHDLLVPPAGSVLEETFHQIAPRIPETDHGVFRDVVGIDGIVKRVLFEHPDHDLGVNLNVPRDRPIFRADVALEPQTYTGPTVCGGAVTFTLSAIGTGTRAAVTRTARETIDPKHFVADRRWVPFSLDLTPFAGKSASIHFQTSASDLCAAWSVWGEPRFVPPGPAGALEKLRASAPVVYQAPGVVVYRIAGSLPRLTLYHHAQRVADAAAALAAITAPAFDIRRSAVIEGPLPPLASADGPESVTVTRMTPDRVDADVVTPSNALLMQNDSFYPGWTADVDGITVPIVRADAIFRGIPIPAGQHHITIAYESATVRLGSSISLIAVAITLGAFVWELVRRPLRRRVAVRVMTAER